MCARPRLKEAKAGQLSFEAESPEAAQFRRKLMVWYKEHARELPWRGVDDPYRTWVSEVMLQQTRVAAVIEHYEGFLRKFPTLVALALAPESAVLAAWSGLGYYTSAAIASIAFGESIAVVDGNVERVLLRVTGRDEEGTSAGKAFVQAQAAALVPKRKLTETYNAAGDHNQAMMELGATLCLPRAPLCLQCPLYTLCQTRGEHITPKRKGQRSMPAAYLLSLRKRGTMTEVLLEQRANNASLMPGMYELPPLPQDAVTGREPVLRLRHSITSTNYYVQVFTPRGPQDQALRRAVPGAKSDLFWIRTNRLAQQPLTGLARKVLQRLDVMEVAPLRLAEDE